MQPAEDQLLSEGGDHLPAACWTLTALPLPLPRLTCSLLKTIFQVRVVTVSLLEAEQVHFVAASDPWACRANRANSLCDIISAEPQATMRIVEDTLLDARCAPFALIVHYSWGCSHNLLQCQ